MVLSGALLSPGQSERSAVIEEEPIEGPSSVMPVVEAITSIEKAIL